MQMTRLLKWVNLSTYTHHSYLLYEQVENYSPCCLKGLKGLKHSDNFTKFLCSLLGKLIIYIRQI
jgi:hypothetical protein